MPGTGAPMWPERTSGLLQNMAEGADSVMPRPVHITMRSPMAASCVACRLSHTGWARPAPE